jgi:GTP-sensing pleiotropic transcriptional regulator CodY
MELMNQSMIETLIFTVRGQQVMLDYHLAAIYEVETKRLNEQVKRNKKRFPDAFMFQLSEKEWDDLQSQIATAVIADNLRSQIATAKRRSLPYVFTEQGVSMLSAVLNSEQAIQVSIQIMQAFVRMRKFLSNNVFIFQRLERVEIKQLQADQNFEKLFKALEQKQLPPDKGIFFNGQMFDAYVFAADLIKQAKSSLILIDNYLDESVLLLLTKRNKGVAATIYTQRISNALRQDLKKHNSQYDPIAVKALPQCHDRFLILDRKELYLLGASLKDLGKKWFAFSKMSDLLPDLLAKLPK